MLNYLSFAVGGKKMLFNMLSRFVIASQFPIVSHPLLCTEYQRFFPSFTKKEKAIYEVEKPQGNRKLMKTQKWSYENNHCYAPSAYQVTWTSKLHFQSLHYVVLNVQFTGKKTDVQKSKAAYQQQTLHRTLPRVVTLVTMPWSF